MSKKHKSSAAPAFEFKPGYPAKVSADVAAQELHRIREANGVVKPQAVVDAARPDDAPLHPVFEWDDEKAAEAFRREQARGLIRAVVRVVPATTDQPSAKWREFVSITGDGNKTPTQQAETVYRPTLEVVDNEALYLDALQRLLGYVRGARHAVDELERAARAGGMDDRAARVALAMKAAEAFQTAVQSLH